MNQLTILDGAGGTTLWEIAEKNGYAKDPVWKYNVEHPELVVEMHRMMIAAGAQIIYTNTFGANRPMVSRTSNYSVEEIVTAGVELAKKAAEGTGVKVALSCGPLSELLEPYGDLEEEEAEEIYREQIAPGVKAGADLVVIETFIDAELARIAVQVAKSMNIPTFCTCSFEKVGRTMMGQTVAQVCEKLEAAGADAVGMNCSLGPDYALPVIREFAEQTKLPLIFKPNAGMPGQTTDPETFAQIVSQAFPLVTYVGGCCNCSPDYIRAIQNIILSM